MILTSSTGSGSTAQHRAARRALTLWKVRPLGGRRRAGVPTAAVAAPLDVEQLARADRFHNYGVTR